MTEFSYEFLFFADICDRMLAREVIIVSAEVIHG